MWHGWSVGIWGNEINFFFWRWVKQVETWDLSYRHRYRNGIRGLVWKHVSSCTCSTSVRGQKFDASNCTKRQPLSNELILRAPALYHCFVVMECILGWKTNKLKFTFRKSITWWVWSSQHHNERRLRVITPTIKPVTELSQTVGATGYYRKSSLHNSPVLRNQTGYGTQLLTVGLSIKRLAL